jgi:hypothetical protein
MDKVAGMATDGIKDTFSGDIMKGAGEMLAAPLQIFNKGGEDKAKENQSPQVVNNFINITKGEDDGQDDSSEVKKHHHHHHHHDQVDPTGGATASASASASS